MNTEHLHFPGKYSPQLNHSVSGCGSQMPSGCHPFFHKNPTQASVKSEAAAPEASDHLSVMWLVAPFCISLPHLPGAWSLRHNLIAVLRTWGSKCQHIQGSVEWQEKRAPPHPLSIGQGDTSDHRGHRSHHRGGKDSPADSRGCREKGPKWLGCSSQRDLPAPSPGLWTVIPAPGWYPSNHRGKQGPAQAAADVGGSIEPTHSDPDGATGRPPSDQHQLPISLSAPGWPPGWTKGYRSWSPLPHGDLTHFLPSFVCPGAMCCYLNE